MVFPPLSPQKMIILKRVFRQRLCSHLPPPPLFKNNADNTMVISPSYIKLALIWLVWVDKELLLLYCLFFIRSISSSDYVSKAVGLTYSKGVSGPLLSRNAGWHVWSHHAIFFVYYLVERYENSFFGTDLELTGLQTFEI